MNTFARRSAVTERHDGASASYKVAPVRTNRPASRSPTAADRLGQQDGVIPTAENAYASRAFTVTVLLQRQRSSGDFAFHL
jgi:hypothetical protein